MFGAVNALFAGLAFGGVILALFLQQIELRHQREELGLQREELKLTRNEIAGQKAQLESQDQTLKNKISRVRSFSSCDFKSVSLSHCRYVSVKDEIVLLHTGRS